MQNFFVFKENDLPLPPNYLNNMKGFFSNRNTIRRTVDFLNFDCPGATFAEKKAADSLDSVIFGTIFAERERERERDRRRIINNVRAYDALEYNHLYINKKEIPSYFSDGKSDERVNGRKEERVNVGTGKRTNSERFSFSPVYTFFRSPLHTFSRSPVSPLHPFIHLPILLILKTFFYGY
jgi:hypothetical protein